MKFSMPRLVPSSLTFNNPHDAGAFAALNTYGFVTNDPVIRASREAAERAAALSGRLSAVLVRWRDFFGREGVVVGVEGKVVAFGS